MNTCVNTEAGEFRTLQERSGLPDFLLEVLVASYQDQHGGEWPHLDEIPADWLGSKESLGKLLKLDNMSITTQKNLLDTTNTQSLKEARWVLNDIYRNLKVDFYTINDKVKITTERKPTPFEVAETEKVDLSQLSSSVYISKALEELENKMGIVTHNTTTFELQQQGLLDKIPEASTAAAFIYQGEIYVNQNIAGVDGKAHELMHVLMGSIKFKNPQLYAEITNSVEALDNYQDLVINYPNRARADVNEEIFVREYARMLTGLDSKLKDLNPNIIYNLNYEMSRVLDTMLDGDNSVRVIPASERFTKTFRELGEIVNAHNMENNLQSYIDGAVMHRILANKKSDLMSNGTLIEECE